MLTLFVQLGPAPQICPRTPKIHNVYKIYILTGHKFPWNQLESQLVSIILQNSFVISSAARESFHTQKLFAHKTFQHFDQRWSFSVHEVKRGYRTLSLKKFIRIWSKCPTLFCFRGVTILLLLCSTLSLYENFSRYKILSGSGVLVEFPTCEFSVSSIQCIYQFYASLDKALSTGVKAVSREMSEVLETSDYPGQD